MKIFRLLSFFLIVVSFNGKAQEASPGTASDTMTLAQAYINLYLTETYFDTISDNRISKILPFEERELKRITDTSFIRQNSDLFNFTYSLLYFNKSKFFYRTKNEINRDILLGWKDTLGEAISSFSNSNAGKARYFDLNENSFYETINFDEESVNILRRGIYGLKSEFGSYFNEDIFPDFKRIFYASKNSKDYHFDSLTYYSGIYNMALSLSILKNETNYDYRRNSSMLVEYDLDLKLDLISRYLQLKYLVSEEEAKIPDQFDSQLLYDAYYAFVDDLNSQTDVFLKEEFNSDVTDLLYAQLKRKFPISEEIAKVYRDAMFSIRDEFNPEIKYFFPNPAPLSSAKLTIRNFKPELTTLAKADLYLSRELERAGYNKQLHYYYSLDGFALTTSLEKFNKNGPQVPVDSRFSKTLGGEGKFSYYEVFKSLFFEIESEFRMFAFIVASKEVTFSSSGMSPAFAEELLKNSYETLPEDLKIITLPNKNLSILVYHFHQNDIGEVPMLDLSGEMTAEDHLKNARLTALIRNR